MKRFLMLCVLLGCSTGASAGYQFIPYYGNNPFLFCTLGVPWDCWAPVSKELGTFTVTDPECFNGVSATLFATVCPQAFPVAAMPAAGARTLGDPADASP